MTTQGILPNRNFATKLVIVSDKIYQSAVENADAAIELFHGYTYSAHPIATAASLATLQTYDQNDLFGRAQSLSSVWEEGLHSLKGLPNVIDLRNLGLVGAIELSSREGAPGARATEAMRKAWDAGLMIRVTGDIIALSPPLIITQEEIQTLFSTLADILRTLRNCSHPYRMEALKACDTTRL
ncbi:MAG: aminotransferase class III-fold pyridoxal phosphate-dependent enzyme [Pseudoruegeria sp.]